MEHTEIINAQQEKYTHAYTNAKATPLKTNTVIWFDKSVDQIT